jgi:hypothetical protein
MRHEDVPSSVDKGASRAAVVFSDDSALRGSTNSAVRNDSWPTFVSQLNLR